MTEREQANQRLRWSLERLHFLFNLGPTAPHAEVAAAWAEHNAACRALCRLEDGLRR